ncbi:sigma-70 family RNA polymerase sigma factor [Staphylococcus xylosus]|uniref:sigma-70 family RNA polymerase sigma factor n=1 Tax=Staphylococcus xylosus TaxID=1288 RepID=UPI001F402DAF|nr:sigma-70 family RNA polymerase sigma factor [Staphylococcus xylosus]MCE4994731.1 sigma-70 family RNA polymerase sigma factor [Staphylococcus xylosus]MCE7784117.1 sigma-70 family RNA polymerase sigma factor [Staphylococcus xylosus]
MRYDNKTVQQFILNYHNIIDTNVTFDEDIGIDDFFNVNDQSETHSLNNSNVEDVIFFNELEAVVEIVTTVKKNNLFLLFSNGVSFKKAGSIFGVQAQRVRQMFNVLLDKLK